MNNTEDTESTEGHRESPFILNEFDFLSPLWFSAPSVALNFDYFLPLGVFQTTLSQRTLRRGGAEKFR
jgi:hypothetical protein